MMIANAFQVDVLTVEIKAFLLVELQGPKAKDSFVLINQFSLLLDGSYDHVKIALLQTPQLRTRNIYYNSRNLGCSRRHINCVPATHQFHANSFSIRSKLVYATKDLGLRWCGRVVLNCDSLFNCSSDLIEVWCRDVSSPVRYV